MKKQKVVVIGANKPYFDVCYTRKCMICGKDVYLVDDWSEYDAEFICHECAEKKDVLKHAKILPRSIQTFFKLIENKSKKLGG